MHLGRLCHVMLAPTLPISSTISSEVHAVTIIMSSTMSSTVHSIAASGFAKGTNDFYDQKRPSYPAQALEQIAKVLPKPHNPSLGLRILEPGSGTGIFSRLLLSPPDGFPQLDIGELVAIEPSEGMRATWESRWGDSGLHARTVEGTFDDFRQSKVEPGTVDAVIIAQAWHWCPDHEAALREVASYLQPNGVLIFIWNLESGAPGYHRQLRDVYEEYTLDTPQYYKGWWKAMYGTKAYEELFAPATHEVSQWSVGMTDDQIVDRLFSKSYLTEAHLTGDERVKVEQRLREVIRRGDEKEWVDEKAGQFRYSYDTDVYIHKLK